jgi:drug/metabolite transporter (DMT)-like permease
VLLVGGSVAASSLLGGYPVLGGQAIRYLVAGLLLAAWARLRRQPLPRPAGREWAWLAGLAVIGLAGCSVLLIEATRVADPASVGIIIGAAPLVIVIAAAVAAGKRPTRRILLAAAVVTAGSAAAQLGGATGLTWSATGLLLSAGALGGAAGTSLLAAPVLPRLGPLAVTVYACGLAGILLLAAATAASSAGGPPILRTPTATQLAALSYLTVAVTAIVFLTWYAAMKRLGVDRAGLFNGLIPIASLGAVALAGTGTVTPLQCLAALTVLAGVILGLGRTPQARARSGVGSPAERTPRYRSGMTSPHGAGEGFTAVAVVAEPAEARRGRGQQHHPVRGRPAVGPGHRLVQAGARYHVHLGRPGRLDGRLDPRPAVGHGEDQGWCVAVGEPRGQRPVVDAAVVPAGDEGDPATGEGGQRGERGQHVGGQAVIHERHPADLADHL